MKNIKIFFKLFLAVIITLSLTDIIFTQEKSSIIIIKEIGKPAPNTKYAWLATKLNKEISSQFRKKGLEYKISSFNESDIKKNLDDAKGKNCNALLMVSYKIIISPGTIKNDSFMVVVEAYNVSDEKLIYKQEGESIVGIGANSLIEEIIENVSTNLEQTIIKKKSISPSETVQKKIIAKTNNSLFLKSDTPKKGELKVALMLNYNNVSIKFAERVESSGTRPGFTGKVFNYNGQLELSYGVIDYLEVGIIAPYIFKRIFDKVFGYNDEQNKVTEKNKGFEPFIFAKYKILKDEKDGLNLTLGGLYQPQINDKMYNGDALYIGGVNINTDFQTLGGQIFIDKTFTWFTPYLNIEYFYFLYPDSFKKQNRFVSQEAKFDSNYNIKFTLGFEYRLMEKLYIYPQVTYTYYSELTSKSIDPSGLERDNFGLPKMKAWIPGLGVGYQIDSNTGVSLFSNYTIPFTPESDIADQNNNMPEINELRFYGFFSMKFDTSK